MAKQQKRKHRPFLVDDEGAFWIVSGETTVGQFREWLKQFPDDAVMHPCDGDTENEVYDSDGGRIEVATITCFESAAGLTMHCESVTQRMHDGNVAFVEEELRKQAAGKD